MTSQRRAARVARALFVVALCCAGAARAGDDSEAEKIAREDADAEKKAVPLKDEVVKAFDEFRPKLESLGRWCADTEQSLERSRIADVLLAFDPENVKARDWLGFKRQKNRTWKPGPWRVYVNARPEVQAEYAKRRAEVAGPFRERFSPLLDRCRGWTDAGLRARIVRSLVNLFPDDAGLREMHGETQVKGKWVLRESADTQQNRERLSAILLAAPTDAAKVPRRVAAAATNGWTTSVSMERFEVVSDLPLADVQAVINAVLAGQILFARALHVEARFSESTRLYLLSGADVNVRFLAGVPKIDEDERRRFGKLSSYWLAPTECVVARSDDGRIDSSVRQMMSILRGPTICLADAPPWFSEGVGMYLVFKLFGTRKTVMIETGNYSEESISREVAAVDADWVIVARKLVDKGYALDVPFLIGLPLNSATKDDGLFMYALSAYFLEGRPKDAGALFAALGNKGTSLHRALAETCGIDAEALQYRFVRWLHEIPGK